MAVVGRVIGMSNQVTPSPLLVEFQSRQQPRQPAPVMRQGVPGGYDVPYGRVQAKMFCGPLHKVEREEEVEVVSRGWSFGHSQGMKGMMKQPTPSYETTPPVQTLHNPYYMPQPSPYTPTLSCGSLSSSSSNPFRLNEHAAPFTPQSPNLFIPSQESAESESHSDTEVRGRTLESSLVASARSRSATSSASRYEKG
eukprot:TRINITY_DN2773_c0_g1_i2.p1 TRINITY_DN2773_c0_g1~~TRINITY_DN2773_c0_g1_i2.p1  ORF type:complete len:196 (+),score=43.08 TRINITY_DN2773_c0_g1_i2:62-649(+)